MSKLLIEIDPKDSSMRINFAPSSDSTTPMSSSPSIYDSIEIDGSTPKPIGLASENTAEEKPVKMKKKRKEFVWTEKRKAAFIICREARQKNLDKKRAEKETRTKVKSEDVTIVEPFQTIEPFESKLEV